MFWLSELKYRRIFKRLCHNWNVKPKYLRGPDRNYGCVDLVEQGGRWAIKEVVVEARSHKLACITLAHELGHVKRFFQYGKLKRAQHVAVARRREKEIPLTESQAMFLIKDEACAWRHARDILVKIGAFDSLKDLFYLDSDKSLASYCERHRCPNAKHIICNCFCPEKEVK